MTDVIRVSREKVSEAITALLTVNNGRSNALKAPQDDETVYWQRKEWVEAAIQAGLDLESNVAMLNFQPSTVDRPATELVSMPSDAVCLLQAWQTHLGSCREACDEGGKRIWDRIDAVLEKVQPLVDQPPQVPALGGGE
ncbi:hypothetical protein [Pseudomonas aeruginosa]|uniref:hypothetical protein n=1 Tax=Pseudomonas aeruginosa TaxID=287 RepID=UPI0013CE3D64|nr:hypothetical protein [Pseudomonas aeruginosa]